MKAVLLLPLLLTSCVSLPLPVMVTTYSDPPGVFVGTPLVPVEVGAQLRQGGGVPLWQTPSSGVGLRAIGKEEAK